MPSEVNGSLDNITNLVQQIKLTSAALAISQHSMVSIPDMMAYIRSNALTDGIVVQLGVDGDGEIAGFITYILEAGGLMPTVIRFESERVNQAYLAYLPSETEITITDIEQLMRSVGRQDL